MPPVEKMNKATGLFLQAWYLHRMLSVRCATINNSIEANVIAVVYI